MLEKVFATIGILGVIAFMGVVTVFVMEPDLWIITIVVLTIAVIFIRRDFIEAKTRAKNNNQGKS